jgi:hypothetical protein
MFYIKIKYYYTLGAARKKFREKAVKDGDKDAEDRFSYPNLYVIPLGPNDTNAKLFNCAQRGHQQALETYTQFALFSVMSGLRFPLATAFVGLFWSYARLHWANGYAKGDPSKRYEHWASYGIWISLVVLLLGAIGTSLQLLNVV